MTYKTGDRVFCYAYSFLGGASKLWGTIKVTSKAIWVIADDPVEGFNGSKRVKLTTHHFKTLEEEQARYAAIEETQRIMRGPQVDEEAAIALRHQKAVHSYSVSSDYRKVSPNALKSGDSIVEISRGCVFTYKITEVTERGFYGHDGKSETWVGNLSRSDLFIKELASA